MGAKHIEKKCGACKEIKLVEDFYKSKKAGRDGFCKKCRREKDRLRQETSKANRVKKAKNDPLFYRKKKLVKLYGITHDQWLELYEQQGGLCKICRNPETRILYGSIAHLVVDHNHRTGKVRALLCHLCNYRLGIVENLSYVASALHYLITTGSVSMSDIDDVIVQLNGGKP